MLCVWGQHSASAYQAPSDHPCDSSFHSPHVVFHTEIFKINEVQFSNSFTLNHTLCAVSEKSLTNPRPSRFYPILLLGIL